MEIRVERTGRGYSIASSEYLVTFPDGTTQTIWSPPWNDFTPEEEDKCALEYAKQLWKEKEKMDNKILREIKIRLENVPNPKYWKFEDDEEGNLWVRVPSHDLYIGNMEGTSKCCFDLAHFLEHAPDDIDTLLEYIYELEDKIQELNDEISTMKEKRNE